MIFDKLEVGPLGVNCYLAGDDASREALVIDPGADAEIIVKRITALGLSVKFLLLTHGHFDHLGGLKALKEATKARVAVGAEDASYLKQIDPVSISFGFSYPLPPAPDRLLKDGDVLEVGSLRFKVLSTPGHTRGGICIAGENVVFTGDTLFYEGIGRTDLPGGSTPTILDSIHTRLMSLPDDVTVYPGHGPASTIGWERRENPYLR